MLGSIVRIAPNEVAVSDPEAIRTIYSAHAGFVKVSNLATERGLANNLQTDFYLPFRATFGRFPDAFTNLDERQHAERRRIVNSLYSMTNIVRMESSVYKCIDVLTVKLSDRAERNEAIDLSTWVQWYAFDVIGELFFSRAFSFMEFVQDHKGYIQALDLLVPTIAIACTMPSYLRPFFLIGGALVPRVSKALKALKHIENASGACVAERRQLHSQLTSERAKPEDMLESFFSIMREKGDKVDFGLTEIKMEAYGAL